MADIGFLLSLTGLMLVAAATCWSAAEAAMRTGWPRIWHLATVGLAILLSAGLGLSAPRLVLQGLGVGLAAIALALAARERSGGALCLVQGGFGGAVALDPPLIEI